MERDNIWGSAAGHELASPFIKGATDGVFTLSRFCLAAIPFVCRFF